MISIGFPMHSFNFLLLYFVIVFYNNKEKQFSVSIKWKTLRADVHVYLYELEFWDNAWCTHTCIIFVMALLCATPSEQIMTVNIAWILLKQTIGIEVGLS